jgi:hypothetical protein
MIKRQKLHSNMIYFLLVQLDGQLTTRTSNILFDGLLEPLQVMMDSIRFELGDGSYDQKSSNYR